MNGKLIQRTLEKLFPLSIAESWDNVGLQIGTLDKEITSITISLDLTMEVIEEAVSNNSNLIICHHPMIFKPVKSIDTKTYLGKMIQKLIKEDIALYVMHTNFDHSDFGMNVQLGNILGLKNMSMFDQIDDVYGLGVIGEVDEDSIENFIKKIKNNFNIEAVKFIGDVSKKVRKVALIGGSGAAYVFKNTHQDFDLFITGDVSYHNALDAKNLGINILDIGHYFEFNGIKELSKILKNQDVNIPIYISQVETNPFKNL